jgi:hypothetical protein
MRLVAGGQLKDIRLRLNPAGRRLLANFHTLRAKLTISQPGNTLARLAVRFRAPQKRRRP